MSPQELKNLLRIAKNDLAHLQIHVELLEGELIVWRDGKKPALENQVCVQGKKQTIKLDGEPDGLDDDHLQNEVSQNDELDISDELNDKIFELKCKSDRIVQLTSELQSYREKHSELEMVKI